MSVTSSPGGGRGTVLALSGGIGGAKLALGLSKILPPEELTIAVNTGDDFVHLGLHVSPDIDTVVYTLAGVANPETGWGRAGESWNFMQAVGELGGPSWFNLGDRDLATNVLRTHRLAEGATLTAITAEFCARLGVGATVLPATDDPLRTRVRSDGAWLDFQDYFVGRRCEPAIDAVAFEGAQAARLHPDIERLLTDGPLRAVVICPSNPFVSVEPMLAIPGLRALLSRTAAPVVAVSPIIGGKAVKGPTAKMMRELGIETSSKAALQRYAGLMDGAVIDNADRGLDLPGVALHATETLMTTLEDKIRLAAETLDLAGRIAAGRAA